MTIRILGISLLFILINSCIIPSLDPHKYLTNDRVYDPRHDPFPPTHHISLLLFLSLSVLPTPHSFLLNIKDVPAMKKLSLIKRIWKYVVLIYKVATGNTKGESITTIDLLFNSFGIRCMTTDILCFYLQNRLIQTSQTGGQRYSDTSLFSIHWFGYALRHECLCMHAILPLFQNE